MKKILFVCLGNICRSPAAEGVMKRVVEENGLEDEFFIDSAGVGAWHAGELPDSRMRAAARNRGLILSSRARQVKRNDFYEFDLIVTMDKNNYADCSSIRPPDGKAELRPMGDFMEENEVPDPYYGGASGFEKVLDMLGEGCLNLLKWSEHNLNKTDY
jgi:protein-tyrosine phosphatase